MRMIPNYTTRHDVAIWLRIEFLANLNTLIETYYNTREFAGSGSQHLSNNIDRGRRDILDEGSLEPHVLLFW